MKEKIKKMILAWLAPLLSFVLVGSLILVLIIGAAAVVFGPVSMAKDSSESSEETEESGGGFFEKFGNFLSGNGWTDDEKAFWNIIDDDLDCQKSTLVTATIMFYYQNNPNKMMEYGEDIEEQEIESADDVEDITENIGEDIPYGEMIPDVKRLVKNVKKGLIQYEKYVKDTFLRSSPYNEMLEGAEDEDKKVDEIYEQIENIASTVECRNRNGSYGYYNVNCPGVIVTGNYAGTYPLEEYIAGVVKAENGGAPTENLKAQAVMARTFLLKQTNNCSISIHNGQDKQAFIPTSEEKYINAANETAGQVLVLNGEIISTYFASYPVAYRGGFPAFPACGSIDCDATSCTTTFYKMPNADPLTLTTNIYSPSGNYWNGLHLQNQLGHCYGYSQVAGMDLETNHGMDYSEILATFHSDGVSISKSDSGPGLLDADSTGFSKRVSWPNNDSSSDTYFWFSNNNVSYSAGYEGQCTWYAFGRANEILSLAGSEYKWRHAPDAGKWYNSNLEDGENGFKSSTNIDEPKVGSIIVLAGNGAGHVAIVEAVYEDGDIAISEGNVRVGNPNPYGFRYIEKIRPSDYVSQFSRYSFAGYIYLLDDEENVDEDEINES